MQRAPTVQPELNGHVPKVETPPDDLVSRVCADILAKYRKPGQPNIYALIFSGACDIAMRARAEGIERQYGFDSLLRVGVQCGRAADDPNLLCQIERGLGVPRPPVSEKDDLGGPLPGVLPDSCPTTFSAAIIGDRFTNRGMLTMHQHRGGTFVWKESRSAYEETSRDQVQALIWRAIDKAKIENEKARDKPPKTYRARNSMVLEIAAAFKSHTGVLLRDDLHPPFWIGDSTGRPDASRLVTVKNGVVDLNTEPPRLISPTPELFYVGASDIEYHPLAMSPTRFLAFLAQVFAGDSQAIRLLQQWFGLMLTSDTSFQKMLLLMGPKRSGKGTIGRILTALVGRANVAAPTLAGLATNFGIATLQHKKVAIVGDARLSGRTDSATLVERLNSLSGEDEISFDRKHKEGLTARLPTRFMVITNENPSVRDSSGAFASRFIVLPTRQSFYGKEDRGLEAALLAELPGILNWAIDGYRDLMRTGSLIVPDSSREAMQELAELSSPVATFVHEECDTGPGLLVEKKVLFDRWRHWCEQRGINSISSEPVFARDLKAAIQGLGVVRPRDGERRVRSWTGIGLRIHAHVPADTLQEGGRLPV